MRLVPNCVDVARFSPEPETPEEQSRLRQMLGYTDEDFVVLYCGRVCEEKGRSPADRGHGAAGCPPHEAAGGGQPLLLRPRTKARSLSGCAGRPSLCGRPGAFSSPAICSNESLPPYYRLADVACFPAIWDEPAGIVVIEAMACGCPIVGQGLRRNGGISEWFRCAAGEPG